MTSTSFARREAPSCIVSKQGDSERQIERSARYLENICSVSRYVQYGKEFEGFSRTELEYRFGALAIQLRSRPNHGDDKAIALKTGYNPELHVWCYQC